MTNSLTSTLRAIARRANQWLLETPERALDDAYEAALKIRSIEETHFGGGRISPDYGNYGKSVRNYFQKELRDCLTTIRVRLFEFNASRPLVRLSERSITEVDLSETTEDEYRINVINPPAIMLRKLRLIDEVVARYEPERDRPGSTMVIVSENPRSEARSEARQLSNTGSENTKNGTVKSNSVNLSNGTGNGLRPAANSLPTEVDYAERARNRAKEEDVESFADKTGVLPRSILRTVDRIRRELDPEAEVNVVENFRSSKARTIVSLRLVLLLIVIPLLTQQVSKNFVVGPIVDHFRNPERTEITSVFLNRDMEEEAFAELRRYEEQLRFQSLIGVASPLTEEEMAQRMQEKAVEVQLQAFQDSNNAIKNIFSDILSAIAFALVLVVGKRDVAILKSFIDELVYGLSDSAKAFIIILFTDVFVGFHSPHGWEVLLEGISRHFGLAANRDFIFLFIATFPVILDTIFKYWIFRYLNRISPSAVATYRNMNE